MIDCYNLSQCNYTLAKWVIYFCTFTIYQKSPLSLGASSSFCSKSKITAHKTLESKTGGLKNNCKTNFKKLFYLLWTPSILFIYLFSWHPREQNTQSQFIVFHVPGKHYFLFVNVLALSFLFSFLFYLLTLDAFTCMRTVSQPSPASALNLWSAKARGSTAIFYWWQWVKVLDMSFWTQLA